MKKKLVVVGTASMLSMWAADKKEPAKPAPTPPKVVANVKPVSSDACTLFDDGHAQCVLTSLQQGVGQPPFVYLGQDGSLSLGASGRVVAQLSQSGYAVYSNSYEVANAEAAVIRSLMGVIKAQSEKAPEVKK